jgi:SAM-dependent methyltransferase
VLAGRRSRGLVGEAADPLVASLFILTHHHNDCYRELPERVRGGALSTSEIRYANEIARAARIWEPWLRDFVYDVARSVRPLRVLDIGCGSGIYLHWAAQAWNAAECVGVDINESAVSTASANLARWGHANYSVIQGDLRNLPELGRFDLVLVAQVLDYLDAAQRLDALQRIRQTVVHDSGHLLVITSVRSKSLPLAHLDLLERSNDGQAGLPELAELREQLREAGFNETKCCSLVPFGGLWGLVASPQRNN